jgi:hypothetical protein
MPCYELNSTLNLDGDFELKYFLTKCLDEILLSNCDNDCSTKYNPVYAVHDWD